MPVSCCICLRRSFSSALEILNGSLMRLGSAPGCECSKIAAFASLRILLTRVQTILPIFHFADHGFSSTRVAPSTLATFPRAAGLDRGVMAGCRTSLPRSRCGLFCKRCRRRRGMTFFSQSATGCARTFRGGSATGMALPFAIVPLCLVVCLRGLRPFARRLQFYTSAPSFRQADRNGLLGRRRAMFSLPHMVHFFSHELSRLSAG